MAIEHKINIFLSHTSDQNIAFDELIKMICQIDGVDSGGLYLVNPDESLQLVAHFGLSDQFISRVSFYTPESINSIIVNNGKSIYDSNINSKDTDIENIKSTVIIPILYKNKSIACLNLASHKYNTIPVNIRENLESIALNLGGAISRIKSEENLKISQFNFLTLFNTIEDFLFILDEKGNCIETNNSVKTKLGYTEEELINKPVTDFHPIEKRQEAIEIIMKMLDGRLDSCPIPLMCKNGKTIPVETKVTKGIWNNKNALFGISRDITKRKKAEDDLQDSLKKQTILTEELKIANSAKNTLFSIISHDLRSPIGNLMQMSEMISENIDNDYDIVYLKTLVDMQKTTSKNTFFLLENLLNWSKYNSEKIEYHPEILNLNNIIEKNIENIKYQLNTKNISVLFDCLNINCFADKNMVELIIRNILSNAVKFTYQDGQIIIDLFYKDSMVIIKITDTGIGISKENIKKILSDNQTFISYGTSNEKGTGLGLKLCEKFIEINQGELFIESVLKKGTSISFSLPI